MSASAPGGCGSNGKPGNAEAGPAHVGALTEAEALALRGEGCNLLVPRG